MGRRRRGLRQSPAPPPVIQRGDICVFMGPGPNGELTTLTRIAAGGSFRDYFYRPLGQSLRYGHRAGEHRSARDASHLSGRHRHSPTAASSVWRSRSRAAACTAASMSTRCASAIPCSLPAATPSSRARSMAIGSIPTPRSPAFGAAMRGSVTTAPSLTSA